MKRYQQLATAGVALTMLGVLAGCGTTQVSAATQGTGSSSNNTSHVGGSPVVKADKTITFFQNIDSSKVKLVLHPDKRVSLQLPNVSPPKQKVLVYLPVYPGASITPPVPSISDMGTGLDGDMVDGSMYFKSKDAQAKIKSWYVEQFRKLGYKVNGQGQSASRGQIISDYFGLSKASIPYGNPTTAPDISLGFLAQKQGNETIFDLTASYIVTPKRPKDSYLPTDIVKVVLTEGKKTRTITEQRWIKKIVDLINTLQVSTPRITSGGLAFSAGTPTTIQAAFYEKNGSRIHVQFSLISSTVTVGNSKISLNTGPTPTLMKDIQSALK